MEIQLSSIGIVKNNITEKMDSDWGKVVSEIVINDYLADGLRGLNGFSHIIVVYYLHEAKFNINSHLVRNPQGRCDMPLVGILSQRAKDRPNPIGITSVKLIDIVGNIIKVKGLDAVNNTPVLDIKPYYPVYDCKSEAIVPDWTIRLMNNYF